MTEWPGKYVTPKTEMRLELEALEVGDVTVYGLTTEARSIVAEQGRIWAMVQQVRKHQGKSFQSRRVGAKLYIQRTA
jgi:hypothetical protein